MTAQPFQLLPGLGFRQRSDSRDMLFPMRAPAITGSALPKVKRCRIGPVLDQGTEGACVGFACRGLLNAEPYAQKIGPTAREIYLEARLNDEFDDRDVPEGTSVRAGLNVLKRHGLIVSYHWAPNIDTLIGYLAEHGPAVAGTDWYSYATDFDGRARYEGRAVGGHAYLLTGYDLNENVLFAVNSWGPGYGKNGEFFITINDFARQLTRGGVAAGVREK